MRGAPVVSFIAVAVTPWLLVCSGCGYNAWQANFSTPARALDVDREAPYVKVHLQDGGLWVLEDWRVDEATGAIRGTGLHYDVDRTELERATVSVDTGRIAVIETTRPLRVRDWGGVATGSAVGVGATVVAIVVLAAVISIPVTR